METFAWADLGDILCQHWTSKLSSSGVRGRGGEGSISRHAASTVRRMRSRAGMGTCPYFFFFYASKLNEIIEKEKNASLLTRR